MSQSKSQANETIKNASYSGGKQNWIFKMYITRHQKCHQVLEEYSKLVPPARQMQDLIDGIDCSNWMMTTA